MSEPVQREPWPYYLAGGLLIVVLVNAVFIWTAVSTAPEIDPSYEHAAVR